MAEMSDRERRSNVNYFDAADCPIVSVVVYRDRAEVCRSIVTDLEKGDNEVVLRKLSSKIDKDSIRVEGKGAAVINEVTYNSKYVSTADTKNDDRVSHYKVKLADLQKEKKALEAKKHRLQKQRTVLDGFADNLMKPSTVTDKPEKVVGEFNSGLASDVLWKTVLNMPEAEEEEGTQASLTRVLDRDLLEGMTGFFDLYENQAQKLDASLHQLTMDMEALDEEIVAVTKNINQIDSSKDGFQEREVSVMLETRDECEIELLISYVVSSAKWAPKYDIRVYSQDKMMKIIYYGIVQQSTGEDWIDAKLSLSTAMPSLGGSPPQLGTQMLTFKPKGARDSSGMVSKIGSVSSSAARGTASRGKSATKTVARAARKAPLRRFSFRKKKHSSSEEKDEKEKSRDDLDVEDTGKSSETLDDRYREGSKEAISPPPSSPDDLDMEAEHYDEDVHELPVDAEMLESTLGSTDFNKLQKISEEEVRESLTSTAYEILRRSTILGDNTGHKVAVGIVDLEPVFEHDTVPKRSPHAFVKVIAKNTSQYALLPGPSNVFFDNNFVAKTSMKSVSPSEEFTCSLGVDPSVRVAYRPIHKYRETGGIISKTTTTTYRQVIEVKNTRQDAIKITVHEQLPLSSEEKIKVHLLEPSIKDKNDKTNKPVRMDKNNNIVWLLEVASCSSQDLVLKYTVDHPSGEEIEFTETAAAQA